MCVVVGMSFEWTALDFATNSKILCERRAVW